MVVSRNTFLDGSVELPSPPKTGASISITAVNADARDVSAYAGERAARAGYRAR